MTLVHAAGRHLEPRCRPAHDFTPCLRPFRRLLEVAAIGLLVWTFVLAFGPSGFDGTRSSRLLWAGFDTVEVAALAVTLWAVYRSRPLAVPAALVAGTLFLCDAWFDVILSWNTDDHWWSIASAVVLELPFTALLWASAYGMARALIVERVVASESAVLDTVLS